VAFKDSCLQTSKDRLTLSATQMFSRDSISGDIRYMCIFTGFSGKEASNDSGVVH